MDRPSRSCARVEDHLGRQLLGVIFEATTMFKLREIFNQRESGKRGFYRNQCRVLEKQLSDAEEILIKHKSPGGGTLASAGLVWPKLGLLELRRLLEAGRILIEDCVNDTCLKAYLRRGERTLAFTATLKELIWCISLGYYNSRRCLPGRSSMAMDDFPLPDLGASKELYMLQIATSDDERELLEAIDVWIGRHECSVNECGGPQRQPKDPPMCIAAQILERRNKEKKKDGIAGSQTSEADHKSVLWNVNRTILRSGRLIGRGGYCYVYEATWLGDMYAKKVFEGETPEDFRNELIASSKLSHPQLVTVLAYSMGSQACSLLMERMPCDLRDYMRKRQDEDGINPPFSVLAAIDLIFQGAEAMRYVHSEGMVHRDLKASNILVKPVDDPELCKAGFLVAKLADFGLAKAKRDVTAYSNVTKHQGTKPYMAPEMFRADHDNPEHSSDAYPKKSDVYSFGIVCSEIVTGKFHDISKVGMNDLYKKLTDSKNPLRPELPASSCPEQLASLIRACWHRDPVRRPGFEEICTILRYLKGLLMLTDETGDCRPDPWLEAKLQSLMVQGKQVSNADPNSYINSPLKSSRTSSLEASKLRSSGGFSCGAEGSRGLVATHGETPLLNSGHQAEPLPSPPKSSWISSLETSNLAQGLKNLFSLGFLILNDGDDSSDELREAIHDERAGLLAKDSRSYGTWGSQVDGSGSLDHNAGDLESCRVALLSAKSLPSFAAAPIYSDVGAKGAKSIPPEMYLQPCQTAPAMSSASKAVEKLKRPEFEKGSAIVTQVGIGLMIYLVFGVAIYAWKSEGIETFSVVDALYFCVITMCTIGYGDIVPQTTLAKLFSCLFVLIGFGFIGALVSGMVTYVLDNQEHLLLSAVEGSHFRTAKKYFLNAKHGNRMRIRMKVGMALVMPMLCILIGTSVMMKFEPVFFL